MSKSSNKGYILEIIQVSNSIKVTAVDPVTGIEAVVIMPANSTRLEIEKHAVAKLEYVISKNK